MKIDKRTPGDGLKTSSLGRHQGVRVLQIVHMCLAEVGDSVVSVLCLEIL